MHACRTAACIAALTLAIVLGTAEATSAVSDTRLEPALRNWLLTGAVVAVLAICTTAVIERLDRIDTRITARRGAEDDYSDIERGLDRRGNIHTLYPKE